MRIDIILYIVFLLIILLLNTVQTKMAFKNKNIIKNAPFFTHFASIPFIRQSHRIYIDELQQQFRQSLQKIQKFSENELLRQHNHKLCHLTLFKLTLKQNETKLKLLNILASFEKDINEILQNVPIRIKNINYFTRFNKNSKCKEITVIYLELQQEIQEMWVRLADRMLRSLLKEEVLVASQLKQMNVAYDHKTNLYRPETLHISLFRARNLLQDDLFLDFFQDFRSKFQPFEWNCQSFHISTMLQYSQDEFYLPFHKQIVSQQQKVQQK